LRTWRYVMQETYESPEGNKDDQFTEEAVK